MQSTLIEPSCVTLRTAPQQESKKGTFIFGTNTPMHTHSSVTKQHVQTFLIHYSCQAASCWLKPMAFVLLPVYAIDVDWTILCHVENSSSAGIKERYVYFGTNTPMHTHSSVTRQHVQTFLIHYSCQAASCWLKPMAFVLLPDTSALMKVTLCCGKKSKLQLDQMPKSVCK